MAYPADENSIEALQQLCGNLFSALLVPVAERAYEYNVGLPGGAHISGDSLLLSSIVVGAGLYYRTFNSALKRSALDCAGDVEQMASSCDVVFENIDTVGLDGTVISGPLAELDTSMDSSTATKSSSSTSSSSAAAAAAAAAAADEK